MVACRLNMLAWRLVAGMLAASRRVRQEFLSARNTLAVHLAQQAGDNKMCKLLASIASFMANLAGDISKNMSEVVMDEANAARGVDIPENQKAGFEEIVATLSKEIESGLGDSIIEWDPMTGVFFALKPWMQPEMEEKVDIMVAFLAAKGALDKYSATGPDAGTVLATDPERERTVGKVDAHITVFGSTCLQDG